MQVFQTYFWGAKFPMEAARQDSLQSWVVYQWTQNVMFYVCLTGHESSSPEMEGAMFQTLQCVLGWKDQSHNIRYGHFGFFSSFVLVHYISPGGPLVVLKEAVDYAEEECKAWKTGTEYIFHFYFYRIKSTVNKIGLIFEFAPIYRALPCFHPKFLVWVTVDTFKRGTTRGVI